jgi:TP901 family phage tail tape measure protein
MADILNVKFTANADFGQLISEANRAMAVLSKFRNQALTENIGLNKKDFDGAVGEFRKAVTAAGYYNSSIVDVTSSTQKFGKELAGQRLKLKDYYSAWSEYSRGAQGQIRKLAQEQVRMNSSIVKSLGRDVTGAQKAMVITPTGIDAVANASKIAAAELSVYHKVLRDGSTSLINWGKNTQWAGRQLTVGLTLPLAIFGKTASEAFRAADMELTRLAKVYGGIGGVSSQQLAQVKKDVTELSKTLASTYGASFQETIALGADIAATGKEGNDLLGSIAETTRLATLGDVDRQEAMKATLALQSAFNMNTKELAESINFLNAVENQTSTTLEDLVIAIPKAGPVIKGLGGDVEDLALLLTAMKEGGINASEGANALKSGLASMINPTKVSRDLLMGWGVSVDDIVTGNTGNVVGMIQSLKEALDKLDPLQKQQAIEQLFGKYQFARINALLENIGKEGSQTMQVFDLMKASTSELGSIADRELKALTDSASGRYKRALETFKAAIADIGEPFLNIMAKVLDVGGKVLGVFGKMPAPLKAFVTGMGVLTALAGPLIMLTGLMANFFGYIIKGVNALRQFRSGADSFKLVTTETIAADQVADAYTQSIYSQKDAATILRVELERLAMAYRDLASSQQGGAPGPNSGTVIPPTIIGPGGGPQVNVPSEQQSLESTISSISADPAKARSKEMFGKRVEALKAEGLDQKKAFTVAMAEVQDSLMVSGAGGNATGFATAVQGGFAGYQDGVIGGYGGDKIDLTSPDAMDSPNIAHTDPAGKVKGKQTLAPTVQSKGANEASKKLAASPFEFKGRTYDAGQLSIYNDEELMTMGSQGVYMGSAVKGAHEAYPQFAVGDTAISGKKTKIGDAAASFKRRFVGRKDQLASQAPVSTVMPVSPAVQNTRKAIDVYNDPNTDMATRKSIDRNRKKTGQAALGGVPDTRKVEKGMVNSAKAAKLFNTNLMMSVGTLGMAASMLNQVTGLQSGLVAKAGEFAMALGYGLPAIKALGGGLKTVGGSLAKSGGLVGGLGRGLAMIGGPYGMAAVAGIVAVTMAIKFMQKQHAEALAKAKADINVSAEAVEKFGGQALNAQSAFKALSENAGALRSKMARSKEDLSLLPNQKEIDAVKEDVKNLMQDQIKAAGGLKDRGAAEEFARNLKATLVSQGVAEAQANAIIGSILQQAGKEEFTVPVMLAVKGISTKESALDALSTAAEKTFNDIQAKLNAGLFITEATQGRFATQISNLAGLAVNQVGKFEDINDIVSALPDGMENLNFQQLQATYSGQQLLAKLKETNAPLYEAFMTAGTLGDAITQAAANTLGLVSALSGVEASFDIAAQQAQNLAMADAYGASGIQKKYDLKILAENKAIAAVRRRAQAEKNAAENEKNNIDEKIDKLKEEIDVIQDATDKRKDQLRVQEEAASFEKEIATSRAEQNVAMMTGNFAEAAIIGLQIDKKMNSRSVDLAEKAIDDKAKAEIAAREEEIKRHEDRKKEIKELTDAQMQAIDARTAKEVAKHQEAIKAIQAAAAKTATDFRKLYLEAAQGNEKSYNDLKTLLGKTGGDLGVLQGSFTKFAEKATADFKKFFTNTIKALLGSKYQLDDATGKIYENGPDGKRGKQVGDMGSGFLQMFGFTGGASGGVGYFAPPADVIKDQGAGAYLTIMKFKDKDGKEYEKNVSDLWLDRGDVNSKSAKKFAEETGKGSAFIGYVKPRYKGGAVKAMYAAGGLTTSSSMPYMVGEKGPELFIPNMNGNVVPSDRLFNAVRQMNLSGSAGGNEYNINVSVMNSGATADQIANAIQSKMKLMDQRVGISRNV